MNVLSPNKWWFTLKSAGFGSSSTFHLLVGVVAGGLVCESVGKADLLSGHFVTEQSRVHS